MHSQHIRNSLRGNLRDSRPLGLRGSRLLNHQAIQLDNPHLSRHHILRTNHLRNHLASHLLNHLVMMKLSDVCQVF